MTMTDRFAACQAEISAGCPFEALTTTELTRKEMGIPAYNYKNIRCLPSAIMENDPAVVSQAIAEKSLNMHGPHWSKDFVEHLRTVHFALLAISLASLVVAFSPADKEIVIAHRQAQEITDLSRKWSSNILDDWAKTQIQQYSSEHTALPFQKMPTEPADADFVELFAPNERTAEFIFRIDFKSQNWASKMSAGPLPLQDTNYFMDEYPHVQIDRPKSLQDFQSVWDALNDDRVVGIPMQLQQQAGLSPTTTVWSEDPYQPSDMPSDAQLLNWRFLNSLPPGRKVDAETHMFLKFIPERDRPSFESRGMISPILVYEGLVKLNSRAHGTQRYLLTIPVEGIAVVPLDGQSALAHKAGAAWHHGIFQDSFFELHKRTTGYPSIDLVSLERILATDASKASSETLNLFGVPLPAGLATVFGPLLLLCVQLYLVVHLLQLHGKIRPDDPGWDVAWIGMYQSAFGRAVAGASLCLLPTAAVVALVLRGVHVSDSRSLSWVVALSTTLVSGYLSYLTWSHLPQLSD